MEVSRKGGERSHKCYGRSESEENSSDWVDPTTDDTNQIGTKVRADGTCMTNSSDHLKLELLTNFPSKLDVQTIRSVSPEQAYVGGKFKFPDGPNRARDKRESSSTSCLCLLDACGMEKYVDRIEAEFEIEDFIPVKDERVIIADFKGKMICKMSVYCSTEMMISTDPYHPTGICGLNDGNWMVAMSLIDESKGQVVKYSERGNVMEKITGEEQKTNKYYLQKPYRLTEGYSGDIYVTDTKQRAVLAISARGDLMWKYGGLQKDVALFQPTDICYDRKDSVIVLDKASESIHILNRNGGLNGRIMLRDFLCNILSPQCITIDNGNKLWLGSLRQISIFQLK